MTSGRNCTFQDEWLTSAQFSRWLKRVPNRITAAYCIFCYKEIDIHSMGRQALTSHMKSRKHQARSTTITGQSTMQMSMSEGGEGSSIAANTTALTSAAIPNPTSTCPARETLTNFVVRDDVIRAEIRWILRAIYQRHSLRSCDDLGDTLRDMFPNDPIVQKFSLGRDKISYNICFGLAPYLLSALLHEIGNNIFVLCFDESLNTVSQKCQMDLVVRFWDFSECRVSTRYLNSVFMERSRAVDILAGLKRGLLQLPVKNVLQISMDGPAVNWKVMKYFEAEPDNPQLVSLGSCGLHVIHGAFRHGHSKSGCNVDEFLRGLYYLFKDSPTRRGQFTELTDVTIFPKKFCAVRWTENVPVVDRAIELVPPLLIYLRNVKPKPDIKSFRLLETFAADPLLLPKLHFFRFIASILLPFLTDFQTSAPVAPLLAERCEEVLRRLMKCFISPKVLSEASSITSLLQIDLNSNKARGHIFLDGSELEIGFGARHALKSETCRKATPGDILAFREACQRFLCATTSKIMERCPLKYRATTALTSLSPSVILHKPTDAKEQFRNLLTIFIEAGRIAPTTADQVQEEYEHFCADDDVRQQLLNSACRLDDMYSNLLNGKTAYRGLWNVVKLALILSHGNGSVEAGFSVNEGLLVENLQERSLIAQRMVYDFVRSCGGPLQVNIDSFLLKSVRGSCQRYKDYLENCRKESKDNRKRKLHGQQIMARISDLKRQKQDIQENLKSKSADIDEQISVLTRQLQ